MSRETINNFPAAYRLVITQTMGANEYIEYIGPYQTLGAAKGQLTIALQGRPYEHYTTKVGHIEQTTGAWEEVK